VHAITPNGVSCPQLRQSGEQVIASCVKLKSSC
jgi:hypothetical protein